MSPTATIATVVVALVFVAWLFQSDTKDPGYEAWLKRQQEAGKVDPAQKAAMGIAVTDAGVTKDSTGTGRRVGSGNVFDGSSQEGGFSLTGDSGSRLIDPATGQLTGQDESPTTRSTQPLKPGFGKGVKLNGTFVGVDYVGDVPASTAGAADVPSITFRRDGGFVTQNMAAAEVDMEPGGSAVATLDRGSGRYKLYDNTLALTYTDGLNRKKGPNRTYTVFPVEGPDASPTAITIQGKVFKLDPSR